jgi:hypothetical protein
VGRADCDGMVTRAVTLLVERGGRCLGGGCYAFGIGIECWLGVV